MINFAEGWSPSDKKTIELTKKDLKKLVEALMESEEEYNEGEYIGGINPSYITEILKDIIYKQKYKYVDLRVQLENDGYHLGILIAKKGLYDDNDDLF